MSMQPVDASGGWSGSQLQPLGSLRPAYSSLLRRSGCGHWQERGSPATSAGRYIISVWSSQGAQRCRQHLRSPTFHPKQARSSVWCRPSWTLASIKSVVQSLTVSSYKHSLAVKSFPVLIAFPKSAKEDHSTERCGPRPLPLLEGYA